jgi:primosomal protein N' (replication factor Y)
MYAEVAVNAAAPLRQTFTYRIPEGLDIGVGHAVYVPWGTRTLQGVVCGITAAPSFAEAVRDIDGVIEDRPFLSPAQVNLAEWMSSYYLAPLFDCIALFLPTGFKRRPLTYLQPAFWLDGAESLSAAEAEVLDIVKDSGEAELATLKKRVKGPGGAQAIASLIKKGTLARTYRLARPSVSARTIAIASLAVSPAEARSRLERLTAERPRLAEKAEAVIGALAREGPLPLTRLRGLGFTPAIRRELGGIVVIADEEIVRDPLAGRNFPKREPAELTADQASAASELGNSLDAGAHTTFLLHGVTGSGKTEVYLAALDRALALGRRAIVLVPEIALTPQTVRRFAERFPGQVAVLHSDLTPGEQHDVWYRIRDGHYSVVVGPRGALFAPMPDLGLVIIDEEHEWTYKQQEGQPRYHARRTAIGLCQRVGATLVLGSATPDVETYFGAAEGPIHLLRLPERLVRSGAGVHPGPLPDVQVADLREELKAGNRSIFSRQLAGEIDMALTAREQVILFLNRRGTASFLQCRDCGHAPECHSCAVALTYHEPDPRLVCHYCNRRYPLPPECPACGGSRIRQIGLGTERVEEEVQRQFPGARTVRWDRDVTRGKDAHEAILARFLAHEADVLIGTQMVAKGLDIPLVTVVGVISADIALHLPDIRSGERTFQLLEQVAGRAGRGERPGRVVIQTYTPDHHSIQAAARHDYQAMYRAEIEFRRKLGYPPFGRLARLTFAHTNRDYAQREAAQVARTLSMERDRRGLPNLDVLGAAPALIPRVRGRWRWNVLLRGADPGGLLNGQTLHRGWTVDIDPVSIL